LYEEAYQKREDEKLKCSFVESLMKNMNWHNVSLCLFIFIMWIQSDIFPFFFFFLICVAALYSQNYTKKVYDFNKVVSVCNLKIIMVVIIIKMKNRTYKWKARYDKDEKQIIQMKGNVARNALDFQSNKEAVLSRK
jgi:hypothetical protein